MIYAKKMEGFLYVLVIFALNTGHVLGDVRLPPAIIRQNEETQVFYPTGAPVKLICDAEGYPIPHQYEWYKDGSPLNLQISSTPNSGNITIEEFSFSYQGIYQCHASNKHGVAMSNKIDVKMAIIGAFQGLEILSHSKNQGESIVIPCRGSPKSTPSGIFGWTAIESLTTEPKATTIQKTRRVQVDEYGNLVIANLQKSDELEGWIYRCNLENSKAGNRAFGSYTKLTIMDAPVPEYTTPEILSYTHNQGDDVVALKREKMLLQCLFSGLPAPSVTWTRVDKPLPTIRVDYDQFNTILEISDVQDSDEGQYRCTANSGGVTSHHDIIVEVEAAPKFIREADKPMNTNVTEGKDAVFWCKTDAEPPAEITWYKDGKILQGESIPARVTISDDRTNLRVSSVCRNCKAGGTDLTVYACEAENKHGSTSSSAYLNVLKPTVMTQEPQNKMLSGDGVNETNTDEVRFECLGTTDDSTPLKVTWRLNDIEVEDIPAEINVKHNKNGSVLVITADDMEDYIGKYTCIMTNGYSTVNASANLQADPNDPGGSTGDPGIGSLWWVFLLVGVLLLLLLLLLCCCLYLNRNRGDEYDVDEKERRAGFDPEAETVNMGYEEYRRPEVNPVKGSRASLSSTMKLDDEASLVPYGDDFGVFSEDGSFLGQYNTVERRRNETHL